MKNKKGLLEDYKELYKAYLDLRQELSIINGTKKENFNNKQLKKLIN